MNSSIDCDHFATRMPFSSAFITRVSSVLFGTSLFLGLLSPIHASSYLGIGSQTGTPSGDVRAVIDPLKRGRDPILSRDGVAVNQINKAEIERPEIVGQLSFQRPMRIAIEEHVGLEHDAEMVTATKEYLRRIFGSANVSVYYLSYRDLSSAVRTGQVDFFVSGSAFFALEQSMGGVEQLAALWPSQSENPASVTASVIFRKHVPERPKASDSFVGIAEHDLVAMEPETLGGWLAAAGEIVRHQKMSYDNLLERVQFLGRIPTHVTDVVKADPTVIGVLPACELEAMERAGEISLSDFEIIRPKATDGLACAHSTEVYPGRVFGAVAGIDPTLKKAMTAVLLGMSGLKYGAEWALPVTNRSVYDLFYTLKIGPYQDLASWSFQRFVREHGEVIALLLLMAFLILSYTTSLSILVRRRTKDLRAALHERDRIEAEAAQSRQHISNLERTGIVGQMSTIIAHELKQPLGAITNYGNGLLRRLSRGDVEKEKLEQALKEMVIQAERASKIVERVRSYAKHDYPPRKVDDLSIIIENAIQTFRRSRTTDAELIVRMHSHSMAEVDSWEIELVILNLLKNAADAISGVKDPKIEVCLIPDGDTRWILTVADNGPYLSDEQLSRFFKPLQTSKGAAGMGLGLSIVANIAERHAGNITVARNGARGVKFTMTIPAQMNGQVVSTELGPETVSIYESGGNGHVARHVLNDDEGDDLETDKSEDGSNIPKTVHSGAFNDAVSLMQDGKMRRTRPQIPKN